MAEQTAQTTSLPASGIYPQKLDSQDEHGEKEIGVMAPAPAYRDEKLDGVATRVSSMEDMEPTEEERHTLRHVADKLPKSAFLVAFVELCERFAYYGLSGPFQNYIQNPYKDPSGLPGAIGFGQSRATGLNQFFSFWCYVTPIIGAIVADQFLGRYNTILYFAVVYIVGLIILFCTSLPTAIEHGAALGGLIVAMIVIGLGTGGIKSNVSPLIAEQYRGTTQRIRVEKSGERVIVDPAVTVQRIYMIFYLSINIGSLSPIATTVLEKHVGFWSAYLLPMLLFFVGFTVVVAGKRFYITRPPQGSIIPNAFRAMWIGLMNKGKMDAAKPSYQEEYGRKYKTPWDDLFVEEIKRALIACRIFVAFPIYWLVYNQMTTNLVSQGKDGTLPRGAAMLFKEGGLTAKDYHTAATMQLHGVPNDLVFNLDAIVIIIFIPILDRLVYPFLRRIGIPFRPVTRIAMGFFFAALSMAYAAIVQHLIYTSPPCYTSPLACPAANETEPNHVHFAVQLPAYAFIGLSEIFASITGLEYAYTKAPPSMKSFVMSMFLLTNAFGSALGIALSPTAADPKLVWMYTGISIAAFIAGVCFWLLFSRYNATEEAMNRLEDNRAKPIPATAVKADGTVARDNSDDEELHGAGGVGLRHSHPSSAVGQEKV